MKALKHCTFCQHQLIDHSMKVCHTCSEHHGVYSDPDPNGAIAITGKRGAGKSYSAQTQARLLREMQGFQKVQEDTDIDVKDKINDKKVKPLIQWNKDGSMK